jgi:asparagine synthase (glutamine-hydrolysing)
VADDGTRTVVLDGVLHGASQPDAADLVLRGYVRSGAGVLADLRGFYALAIVDREKGTLLCARDPAGVYPLFYVQGDGELLVSTSTESLLRHPSVPERVLPRVVADHLYHGYPQDLEDTYFAAIKRVPPGHALQAGDGAPRVYRHWDPAPPEQPVEWATEEEVEEFEERLSHAVERSTRLGASGVYLSGGMDSAAVATLAADGCAENGLPPPLALSLVFPHPDCDEERMQRLVATGLGLPQFLASFEQAVGDGGLLAAALRLSSEWPSPLLNLFEPGFQYLGAEARRRGCRVILDGGGGDEWLGLSSDYARVLVRRGDAVGLYRLWDARRRYLPTPPLTVLRNIAWRSGVRPLLRDFAGRRAPRGLAAYRRRRSTEWLPSWLAPDPRIRQAFYERTLADVPESPTMDHYQLMRRRTLDHPLEALVMEDTFAAGTRIGVPIIQPLWDPDVVDLLCRTPPDLLNRGGREKGLLRDLLGTRFPALGREWVKTVFMGGFLASVMLREGRQEWRRLGGASALAEVGLVDPRRLETYVEACFSGQDGGQRELGRIWNILSVEAWLRPRL